MNIENLTQEELQTLHTLLGKALEQPKPKVYLDPVNQMVDEIMEEFNFAKVQTVMEHLGWKWASAKSGMPTIDELREEAERLLRGAAADRLTQFKNEHWELGIINGTGGFEATAYCDENKTKITSLSLQFVVSEWDSEIR
jgi:hypothetical protein